MLQAIVFDFDGILVDSEPLHYRALAAIGSELGVELDYPRYLSELIGFDDRQAIEWFARTADRQLAADELAWFRQRKQALFDELAAGGIDPLPGAMELLDAARAQAMPVAVASGATRRDIELILQGLGRSDAFDAIVTADDVARSKPDPASYRQAVEALARHHNRPELAPAHCLAIEDTATGLASARAAGLPTLGVATSSDAHALRDADRVITCLSEVDLPMLRQWYG